MCNFNGNPYCHTMLKYSEERTFQKLIHDTTFKICQEDCDSWLLQIADGMSYLHSHKIIHSSLNPDR